MKNQILKIAVLFMSTVLFFSACKEDFDPPTITLDKELIEAKAGEEISVNVVVVAPAGLSKVVVTALHNGTAFGTPLEVTDATFTFTYTVTEDDVDPILSLNFTATDSEGQEASKELVVDVELTMTQILLKYNWALTDEIREKTGESDIADAYTDDVYRFNADGTYDKSIGAKVDDFGDIWFNYCYWNLDDATSTLTLTRTGAFLEDVRDVIVITKLDATELVGSVVYLGLDAFNTGSEAVPYEATENYTKKLSAVAKSDNFDPYQAGADDDGGPAGTCNDVTW